jgi:hypothetical protein
MGFYGLHMIAAQRIENADIEAVTQEIETCVNSVLQRGRIRLNDMDTPGFV